MAGAPVPIVLITEGSSGEKQRDLLSVATQGRKKQIKRSGEPKVWYYHEL